jgi:hypothetical protein
VRELMICLLGLLVLTSCTGSGDNQSSGAGGSLRPGQQNRRMSEEATAEVRVCAREAGWNFKDLRVLVDSDGVLIRVRYDAQQLSSEADPREQVLDRCLARAGAMKLPLGS